jgi:hypothetical protein
MFPENAAALSSPGYRVVARIARLLGAPHPTGTLPAIQRASIKFCVPTWRMSAYEIARLREVCCTAARHEITKDLVVDEIDVIMMPVEYRLAGFFMESTEYY